KLPGLTPKQLFEQIVAASPSFRAVLDDHVRDNDELLPHVLMADLLRYLGSYFTREILVPAPPPNGDELNRALLVLDNAMAAGDPDIENAIAVSFIEDIDTEPFAAQIVP